MERTPQQRLDEFISCKFDKKRDFAEAMGMRETDLPRYTKNGKSVFDSYDRIMRLAELGLNPDWYLFGKGVMLLPEKMETNVEGFIQDLDENETIYREIPFINVPANAGLGYTFSDDEVSLVREPYKPYNKSLKKIRIIGDSMYPIVSGSLLIIDESKSANHGDLVVAVVDGILYFKEFRIIEGNKYLYSTNDSYDPIKLNGFVSWKILGVVVEVVYKP